MLTNYLKILFRVTKKSPVLMGANIIGLAIGLCTTLLISIYLINELSYDRFHSDYQNIYRVGHGGRMSGNDFIDITSSAPLAKSLEAEVTGIEQTVRIAKWPSIKIKNSNEIIEESNSLFVDNSFFQFFDFEVLVGKENSLLDEPRKIVLTEKAVKKYFGDIAYRDVMGKSLIIGQNEEPYLITGVAKNTPKNSHIQFDILMSLSSWDYSNNLQWTWNGLRTYLKLEPGANRSNIESQLDELTIKYIGPEIEEFMGISYEDFVKDSKYGFWLQSLKDIHLNSHYDSELEPNGSKSTLIIYLTIGLFLLVVTVVNFVNISTAHATDRAKEVALKRAFGVRKKEIQQQFLVEYISICIVSAIVAIVSAELILPNFADIVEVQFSSEAIFSWKVLSIFILLVLLISLITSIYPSRIISSLEPSQVFRGRVTSQGGKSLFRKFSVGFQFVLAAISIALILTISAQINFMRNMNLGLNSEGVIVISNTDKLKNVETFKNQLMGLGAVKAASYSNAYPTNITNKSLFRVEDTQEDHMFYFLQTDHNNPEVYDYSIKMGNSFDPNSSDITKILINETAFNLTGWKDLENKRIVNFTEEGTKVLFTVVGVVSDFHYQDFSNKIQPLILFKNENPNRFLSVRLSPANVGETLDLIKAIWDDQADAQALTYSFLDVEFASMFKEEKKLAKISSILTILIIVTSLMGLLGLSTHLIRKRSKEFGIRKVCGATSFQLLIMQFKYFLTIGGVSLLIAVPIVSYIANEWLSGFAYRIENTWPQYAYAVFIILALIILSISYQAIKSSRVAPIKVLKDE